jgi:hypothetical protein
MAHLHTYMESVDIHVAIEVCEIVIESATLVNWPRSKSVLSRISIQL